jgi:hypothetical protein
MVSTYPQYCTISTDCSVTRHCDCELNNSGVSSRVTGGHEQLHKQVINNRDFLCSLILSAKSTTYLACATHKGWQRRGKSPGKTPVFYFLVPWSSSLNIIFRAGNVCILQWKSQIRHQALRHSDSTCNLMLFSI